MTSTSTTILPRCGGNHPVFGIYVGGAAITADYKLSRSNTFKSSTQLRTAKTLAAIETALHTAHQSTATQTFNGNLDTTIATDSSTVKLNKEHFLLAVRHLVAKYGLQSLFYLPSKEDPSTMTFLLTSLHDYTIEEVVSEHES